MKIIKRNGAEESFDTLKIVNAVQKACNATENAYLAPEQLTDIADYVEYKCNNKRAISSLTLTHKGIEELDFETRIRKRDELLTQKFSNNEQKYYHNSITGRYAKVFIFFPYLPVFNLFAILYRLILNFLQSSRRR